MKRLPTLISVLALLATSGLNAREDKALPVTIPEKLRVPEGNRLHFSLEADGVQIYVSKEGKDGKPEWIFKAPLAELTDSGKKAGYHFAGPAWEMLDGSRVIHDKSEAIERALASKPGQDIPWLRIKVKADGDQGTTLRHVTYILRVNTSGGLAPAKPPLRVGAEVGVKYKATYQFYGQVTGCSMANARPNEP